jgi:hypothetical protein
LTDDPIRLTFSALRKLLLQHDNIGGNDMTKATVKVYASPGCVLLTFDWADGENHPDFLGFAIERNPGYSRNGASDFLFNKLDFVPPKDQAAKPKPSNKAPFQKFNWWDGGINPADRGKVFNTRSFRYSGRDQTIYSFNTTQPRLPR